MTATLHKITNNADLGMRLGSLEVRLANSTADIDNAQELRYKTFYEEMGAIS